MRWRRGGLPKCLYGWRLPARLVVMTVALAECVVVTAAGGDAGDDGDDDDGDGVAAGGRGEDNGGCDRNATGGDGAWNNKADAELFLRAHL